MPLCGWRGFISLVQESPIHQFYAQTSEHATPQEVAGITTTSGICSFSLKVCSAALSFLYDGTKTAVTHGCCKMNYSGKHLDFVLFIEKCHNIQPKVLRGYFREHLSQNIAGRIASDRRWERVITCFLFFL